jgi:hypothetical protein
MSAEAFLESKRFLSRTDRILAKHEEVPALFPSPEELKARGGNIVVIAKALQNGLTVSAFVKALNEGLDLRAFTQAFNKGMSMRKFSRAVMNGALRIPEFATTMRTLDGETLNWSLHHTNEHAEEVRQNPALLDRLTARAESRF